MIEKKKHRGTLKKVMAMMIGMTMAFGTLAMLPDKVAEDSFISASADFTYVDEESGVKFTWGFSQKTGSTTALIKGISDECTDEVITIPEKVVRKGVEYNVTGLDNNCFKGNKTIKKLIVPDYVKTIGAYVLNDSNIEEIYLPNSLILLDHNFADNCPNLYKVECKYIDIPIYDMDKTYLNNCPKMYNEKGAVCIGNWIVQYDPEKVTSESFDPTNIKVADMGNGNTKIDSISPYVFKKSEDITKVDLKGIKYMGTGSFCNCPNLKEVVNGDSIISVWGYAFINTPWFNKAKEKEIIKFGSTVLYYKTDSDTIDLTSDEFDNTLCFASHAFEDCKNATTLRANSEQRLGSKIFYVNHTPNNASDPLPRIATYKIKNIYLDGEKLEFTKEDPILDEWIARSYDALTGTQWLADNVEAKTKAIFDQMSLTYYGPHNDVIGSLTPTEEFYAVMKIHGYISVIDVDDEYKFPPDLIAYLCSKKVNCGPYARIADYLYECAGVEAQVMTTDNTAVHAWCEVRIGDEWFICDPGWDEQIDHGYEWFCLSSEYATTRDVNGSHNKENGIAYNWHDPGIDKEYQIANRNLGDINSNDIRYMNHNNPDDKNNDPADTEALWFYVDGAGNMYKEFFNTKAGDINFDGTVDITDAVLLENIVNGTALDKNNVPRDSLAPGFKAAFINGNKKDTLQYMMTDRDGYLVLPECIYEAPEGMKFSKYNLGKPGQKVKIENPFTVIQPVWVDINAPDESEPDSSEIDNSSSKTDKPDYGKLGDVNGDGAIDIEDAVAIIQHINGMTPLKDDEEKRADISKDKNIDIDDAVTLISYINGNSTF